MQAMPLMRSRRGVILMFALWVLVFLAVLAVGAAAGIRQKILVLNKLDERDRMSRLLNAGVKFTAVHVRQTLDASGFFYTPLTKQRIHNDPDAFARITLGNDDVQVAYIDHERGAPDMRFG